MSDRLKREDWIAAGIAALEQDGGASLKADVLSKRLGVSRGSFYWHFADLDAFHAAVVEAWQDRGVEAVIRSLERREMPARLRGLLRVAFKADGALENGMRAWAANLPRARTAVAAVDARRLAYLSRLLATAGLAADAAHRRAQILYWAYLGFVLSRTKVDDATLDQLISELLRVADGGAGAFLTKS